MHANLFLEQEGETMDSEHMINDRSFRSGFSNPFILKKNAEEVYVIRWREIPESFVEHS